MRGCSSDTETDLLPGGPPSPGSAFSQKRARKPSATRPETTRLVFAVSGVGLVGSERRSHCALPETQTVHVGSIRQEIRKPATCAFPMEEAYWRYWYQGARVHPPMR